MEPREQHAQIVLRYVEAFNAGDFETLRTLFTPDALLYGVLGWGGLDVAEPVWRLLHSAFETKLRVEGLVVEGDTVAVRYVETGRSAAEFRGLGPTGKSYEIVAMEWFEIKDGRIHRRWGARDSAAQFRQMGLPLG